MPARVKEGLARVHEYLPEPFILVGIPQSLGTDMYIMVAVTLSMLEQCWSHSCTGASSYKKEPGEGNQQALR